MPISADRLSASIDVPDGVSASIRRRVLRVEGPLGRTFKDFRKIPVDVEIGSSSIALRAQGSRRRDHAILNTARSIVRNLVEGICDGYTVRMKIVYAHFPISVKVDAGTVLVENFQGEHAPRRARIVGATTVAVDGDDLVVTGPVLTDVTQTAANIEQNTRIKNKDLRVFLDGIYVYDKKKGIENKTK